MCCKIKGEEKAYVIELQVELLEIQVTGVINNILTLDNS